MKKQLVLFLALALCLGLTACGDTEFDDTQSGYETVMDMEFLDGMWSIDGTAKLYFDSTEGFYAYRTGWGLGGRGEFELSEASGRPMIFFNGFLYNFLLCDDGVLLPNRNGEGSGLTIHRHTFLRDDEAEIVEWDKSNWDGMWQNALGETIVINSSLMQYIACSPDYSMSGTMDDEGEGMGLYLYDNGTRAYLCPGDDGNSFTLSAERFGRYGDDQHFDGVFYRNADFYAYTDMENAEFYEDEYSTFYIWYYDGVNRYLWATITPSAKTALPTTTKTASSIPQAGFPKNHMIPLLTGAQTGWIVGTSEAPRKKEENEMRQRRPFLTFTLALLFCLSLAACGAKQYPMEITVVNRTTYPIADIRISLTSEEDWGENRLETTLAEGESTEIDLGEYTEGQLNEGFSLQFYGEDGEPVNPDYDPSSPMFFDNGDFLIFAPPDLSVALFLDTAYDKEVYDQKIVESYAADGDGRGDVISRDDIPVLMGGALPFTNMQNLLSENHDDGTYRYEDITEDGQLLVVNTAEQSCFVPDVQELDDYLTACALSLSDAGIYELLSAEEHEEYSKNLSYPVYIVTYTAGENEDTREWTVFVMDTDICTYLYGFCAPPDTAADMGETYQNIFSQLYLSDEE